MPRRRRVTTAGETAMPIFRARSHRPAESLQRSRKRRNGSSGSRDGRRNRRLHRRPHHRQAPGPAPAAASGPAPSSPIEDTLQVFERWLILPSRTPVYAMLGTVAANLLAGDPTWLGLIAPPSSAKTELINALAGLPFVVSASTLTPAGLLSGTPKRQQAAGAKGGMLRQVSNPGLLCLKDFTSILTMRPEAKAEILGALREVYDGHYVRRLGTDGGRELEWRGKLGLIFGCTKIIDTHHSVENALGNRFLLSRLEPNQGQFAGRSSISAHRLRSCGASSPTASTRCLQFRGPIRNRSIPKATSSSVSTASINLVVRLRGAVERDRYSREIQSFHGAEGTGRIGLALERLLAGLDALGVERTDRARRRRVGRARQRHADPAQSL